MVFTEYKSQAGTTHRYQYLYMKMLHNQVEECFQFIERNN